MELRERLINMLKNIELSDDFTHEIQEIFQTGTKSLCLQEGRLIQNDNAGKNFQKSL